MKQIPQDVSESVRRRNPHLYPPLGSLPIDEGIMKLLDKNPPPLKRIRQSRDVMNKLELEFWGILKQRFAAPDWVVCQAIRFQLGNGVWYKPDFVYFTYGAIYCFEVKGPHAFRGGFENLKVAAHMYRQIVWKLVWKDAGAWQDQTVLP